MTTTRHETRDGAETVATARVTGSFADWWTLLIEPASVLTRRQRNDVDALLVPGWQKDASCARADPDAWFPDKGAAARPEVFRICAACPVRTSCLASALCSREHGVWAGSTAMDRRGLYRMLRSGAPVAEVLDTALDAPHSGVLGDAA